MKPGDSLWLTPSIVTLFSCPMTTRFTRSRTARAIFWTVWTSTGIGHLRSPSVNRHGETHRALVGAAAATLRPHLRRDLARREVDPAGAGDAGERGERLV